MPTNTPDQHPEPSAASGPFSRRRLFALGAGVAAAGALSAYARPRTTPPGTAAAAPSGDLPKLSQWYHAYGEEGTKDAVERYAKGYTKAAVEVTWSSDYDNALPPALLTDTGPDVFEWGNGPSIDMIRSGQVVDLTDLFTDELKADFNKAVLDRVTYDGKIWAVPQLVDMILLVYRKSMLDKAGVKPPTNLDEMVAAAKALTSGDVKGLFVGNDGGATEMGGPLLYSAGETFLTADGKLGFGDKSAEAFGKLHQMYADGSLLEGQDKDWWSEEAFTSGACAMQWTGLWTFPAISKALGDDWGVAAWPSAGDGGAPVTIFGAFSSCVSAKAKDVALAKDFVKYLWIDNTDAQVEFATAFGFHVPSRASLVPKAKTLQSGAGKEAADLLASSGKPQSAMLWSGKAGTAFNDMMTKIVKDGADPKAGLAELKPIVEAEASAAMTGATAGTTAATTAGTGG